MPRSLDQILQTLPPERQSAIEALALARCGIPAAPAPPAKKAKSAPGSSKRPRRK